MPDSVDRKKYEPLREFLDTLQLPPGDLEKFAHGNADRLLKLKNGTAKK